MGFLDNLINNKEVRKVISRAVDSVVDDTLQTVFGKNEQSSTVAGSNPEPESRTGAKEKQKSCSGERLLRQRIEEIAARELPQYELRQQVSTAEVEAPEKAEPYFEYGFYQDGVLKAVIKILKNNNAYRRKSVLLAQQACREHQVVYMNFMSYMMNRPEYISQRLQENLS